TRSVSRTGGSGLEWPLGTLQRHWSEEVLRPRRSRLIVAPAFRMGVKRAFRGWEGGKRPLDRQCNFGVSRRSKPQWIVQRSRSARVYLARPTSAHQPHNESYDSSKHQERAQQHHIDQAPTLEHRHVARDLRRRGMTKPPS